MEEIQIKYLEFDKLTGCDIGNSIKLKKWLVTFTPTGLKVAHHRFVDKTRDINLNTDYIMPYLKNRLYCGDDGLLKLKLSICALLLIYKECSIEDQEELRNDCLRLYIRLNSVRTKFSIGDLLTLINECQEMVESNYNRALELVNNECKNVLANKAEAKRKKYVSKIYHYKAEDFSLIHNCSNWQNAYEFWLKYQFPELLNKHKEEVKKSIKLEMNKNLPYGAHISNEDYQARVDASGIDKVVIKELSLYEFKRTIKRLKLELNF